MKENYEYKPTHFRFMFSKECISNFKTQLKQIEELQVKLTECLQEVQDKIERKLNKVING